VDVLFLIWFCSHIIIGAAGSGLDFDVSQGVEPDVDVQMHDGETWLFS
jgi:hypothetical protein